MRLWSRTQGELVSFAPDSESGKHKQYREEALSIEARRDNGKVNFLTRLGARATSCSGCMRVPCRYNSSIARSPSTPENPEALWVGLDHHGAPLYPSWSPLVATDYWVLMQAIVYPMQVNVNSRYAAGEGSRFRFVRISIS